MRTALSRREPEHRPNVLSDAQASQLSEHPQVEALVRARIEPEITARATAALEGRSTFIARVDDKVPFLGHEFFPLVGRARQYAWEHKLKDAAIDEYDCDGQRVKRHVVHLATRQSAE